MRLLIFILFCIQDAGQSWLDLGDYLMREASVDKDIGNACKLKHGAKEYYEKAILAGLSGVNKERVEKMIRGIEQDLSRWIVDLLEPISLKDDAIMGTWLLSTKKSLVSPADAEVSLLRLPFTPPEEYDLCITLGRISDKARLTIILAVGEGKQVALGLDGWTNGEVNGLALIDGKPGDQNETTVKRRIFKDLESKTVTCKVRKTRITILVDGGKLIDWNADYKRVGLNAVYKIPDKSMLYIGGWSSSFEIEKISLVQISGQGRKIR